MARSMKSIRLADHEIGAVMSHVDRATSVAQYRLALHLQAVTLLRPQELVAATWDDVDLGAGRWLIQHDKRRSVLFPARRMPLSRQARALLDALRKLDQARGRLTPGAPATRYVVPAFRVAGAHVSSDALGKVLARAVSMAAMAGARVGSASMYDIRHTGVEWLLDHSHEPGTVVRATGSSLTLGERSLARYDADRHIDVQADLLQRWADHLDCCCAPQAT